MYLNKLQLEIKAAKSLSELIFITKILPNLSIVSVLPSNVRPGTGKNLIDNKNKWSTYCSNAEATTLFVNSVVTCNYLRSDERVKAIQLIETLERDIPKE